MHINVIYNDAQIQTNNQKPHQYFGFLEHKKDNTLREPPVTIKSTRRNDYET